MKDHASDAKIRQQAPARRRPRRTTGFIAACILTTSVCASSAVLAQTQANSERAQQLFDEGRALMKAKQYSQACSKLAESQALDPGGGTLLNLGICRRHEGRTATAYSILTEALTLAKEKGRADRVTTAEHHLTELSAILSQLIVRPPPNADTDQLVVAIDGERLSPESLGRAIPLDPGVHEVEASESGYVTWSKRITLAPVADRQTVEVPALEPVPAVPAQPIPVAPLVPSPQPKPNPPPTSVPAQTVAAGGPPRWLGYALTGVGTAALATGTYFGVRALNLRARSDRYFDGTYCKTPGCVQDWSDAKTAAAVTDVAVGVGLVSLGVGAYLLFRPEARMGQTAGLELTFQVGHRGATAVGRAVF